ncbi:MMPL family transporter [Skermania piniformis]|uniref:MMPL family transporter n=1 Tax=Skermania pinensis TaxID=39122 RepID=A0ABX8S954_9ACTN|nr:MMPL family transporter [Skermania piniformis]QXQ14347.1 MMPL family transporter [Skermania piniformis]
MRGFWDRYAEMVTGRRSSVAILAIVLIGLLAAAGLGGESADQAPSSLPPSAESARAADRLAEFPDSGTAPVLVVVSRTDGAELSDADVAATTAAAQRMSAARGSATAAPTDSVPAQLSPDRRVALGRATVDADLSGFDLTEQIDGMRAAARDGLPPGLRAQVTGGPAFGADIADSFSGANFTLLVVTAAVVALLLILTYRSPVLWLIPLLVVALADRAGSVLAARVTELAGLTVDGSTAGITSVLVFGAGTNYALLLVSRYRDELHRNPDHRAALRTAVRRVGPTVVASNATVVLALLTLLVGVQPSTRSLGVGAATGVMVAALAVLTALPAALALCGRRVFWPFVPRADGHDQAEVGAWHAVTQRVTARPWAVLAGAAVFLGAAAALLVTVPTGLTQTEQFRVSAESVDGLETLAAHVPAGSSSPTLVVGAAASAAQIEREIRATQGVAGLTRTGDDGAGSARWSVVLDAEPASPQAYTTIGELRSRLHAVPGADALVGGPDAEQLDGRDASDTDRSRAIPLILLAVLAVLLILLRAVPASLILVAVTLASALAALGLGAWISIHVFGFPALDSDVPLFAVLFLVALGVDYTIFLTVRAREETPEHGIRGGMVRAVAATGTVITSAGIVLAAVFCVLGVLPLIVLTQLGIVVGLGILLDTFLVRTVVIPALFTVVGAKIWWPTALATTSTVGQKGSS